MIPNALIYEARIVNAQRRDAAKAMRFVSADKTSKIVADCSGVRTPCFYRPEATP